MDFEMDNTRERGWILRILDKVYPDPLDQDIIKKQLIDLGFFTGDKDIRGNIAYLKQRGLIEVSEVGNSYLKKIVIALSADGKDLVSGIGSKVPGVDVG